MSRSWEVIGQSPTAFVSCCWELKTLGNLDLRRKSIVKRLGLPRVGQASRRKWPSKESCGVGGRGTGSPQWEGLW